MKTAILLQAFFMSVLVLCSVTRGQQGSDSIITPMDSTTAAMPPTGNGDSLEPKEANSSNTKTPFPWHLVPAATEYLFNGATILPDEKNTIYTNDYQVAYIHRFTPKLALGVGRLFTPGPTLENVADSSYILENGLLRKVEDNFNYPIISDKDGNSSDRSYNFRLNGLSLLFNYRIRPRLILAFNAMPFFSGESTEAQTVIYKQGINNSYGDPIAVLTSGYKMTDWGLNGRYTAAFEIQRGAYLYFKNNIDFEKVSRNYSFQTTYLKGDTGRTFHFPDHALSSFRYQPALGFYKRSGQKMPLKGLLLPFRAHLINVEASYYRSEGEAWQYSSLELLYRSFSKTDATKRWSPFFNGVDLSNYAIGFKRNSSDQGREYSEIYGSWRSYGRIRFLGHVFFGCQFFNINFNYWRHDDFSANSNAEFSIFEDNWEDFSGDLGANFEDNNFGFKFSTNTRNLFSSISLQMWKIF